MMGLFDLGAGANDEMVLNDSPELSEVGQAQAPLPDVSPWVAQTPRLPMPVMPPPPAAPPPPDANPRTKLAMIAALGAALGAGAHTGTGAGILQGTLGALHDKEQHDLQLHQQAMQQWQWQASEADKAQRATQAQQAILDRQHEARLQQTFGNLRDAITKTDNEQDYQKTIGAYSAGLQASGYRINPQALMAQFPFQPPAETDTIQTKVKAYFDSPLVKSLMATNPQAVMAGAISYTRKGVTVQLPIQEALKRLGTDVPTMDAQGNPLFSSIGKGPEAEQAIQRATEEFKTQFGRAPKSGDAKDNDWLTKRAHQFTDKKDPVMESMARTLEQLRISQAQQNLAKPPAADKLVKVEHKDPATGKAVIEWLPQSSLEGQTFEKAPTGMVANRLDSAQAVQQTGNDIIDKLSDPAYANKLGVTLGRYRKLQDFIGNPPPEYAELAGMIESYSLANMGVHGMRSSQGAEMIKKMLDQPHTPQSIIAAIKGLNKFSEHFMQNEGRPVSPPGGGPILSTDPNAGQPMRR